MFMWCTQLLSILSHQKQGPHEGIECEQATFVLLGTTKHGYVYNFAAPRTKTCSIEDVMRSLYPVLSFGISVSPSDSVPQGKLQ
ncbi:hypothetical protein TNCV_607291 [Trichonephila clavipes]|nr:hypothetical protein TNCV_607291 [Trichonephila clavipes]